MKSPKDGRFLLIDNQQTFPRLTSNDSGISFGESDNESIFSEECESDIDQNNLSPLIEQQTITITNDGKEQKNQICCFIYFFFSSYGISYIR
jgi:hypothetical protein